MAAGLTGKIFFNRGFENIRGGNRIFFKDILENL